MKQNWCNFEKNDVQKQLDCYTLITKEHIIRKFIAEICYMYSYYRNHQLLR